MEKNKNETLPEYDLQKFKLTRVLHNNIIRKSCALLGKFPEISSTNYAIILFEKTAFDEIHMQTDSMEEGTKTTNIEKPGYFNKDLVVRTEFINNVYGSFVCIPSASLNSIKTTVVFPATDKHIEKYSICQKFLIKETRSMYEHISLPHILSSQLSLEWVYNILEHKQESDRIIYEDNDEEVGFILLPDLKWDGKNLESLYILAIIKKHNIKSIRDLRGEHLPMLRNIRASVAETIERLYGLKSTYLRMYFHYQPSFYHLHVHINPIRNDAPGIWCEKSHMLDIVINNLELLPDYYERSTLPFVLFEGNKLLELYQNEEGLRKRKKC